MDQDTLDQKMGQLWARCWSDASFKAQLLADPMGVLQAQGLDVPAGLQLVVLEDSPTQVHWVIPARPSQLSDADLEGVAAGYGGSFHFLKTAMPIAGGIAQKKPPALFLNL